MLPVYKLKTLNFSVTFLLPSPEISNESSPKVHQNFNFENNIDGFMSNLNDQKNDSMNNNKMSNVDTMKMTFDATDNARWSQSRNVSSSTSTLTSK